MPAMPMAQALTEAQITTDPSDQSYPAIYGDTIVWQDYRNGYFNGDIYMYDIATGLETRVTTDPNLQQTPAIYGDIIVWADGRGYNSIYMYDISSGTESLVPIGSNNAYNPDIYGDIIVWMDSRNGNYDIYMYNIATGVETPITSDPSNQYDPAIYGDIIVWTDTRNGVYNYDTYMYNIATGVERKVTSSPGHQYWPDIYGDIIVWSDTRNGNYDIYMYNIATGVETRITSDTKDQSYPAIYGDTIVWEDTRSGYDIYMYDIASGAETQVTSDPGIQLSPVIYGDRIVWPDHRNGNWDIYMTTLTPADTTSPVTSAHYDPPAKNFGWHTSEVTVTLSASDPDDPTGITTYYTLDGVSYTYTGTFVVAGDGFHYLKFHSVDPAGNAEEEGPVEIIMIDTTPPTPTYSVDVTPVHGQIVDWYTATPTVTLAGDDGPEGSGVYWIVYQVDGGMVESAIKPAVSFQLGDGMHTITYHVADMAGNGQDGQEFTVNVDTQAPVITMREPSYPGPSVYTLGQQVFADWDMADATSGIVDAWITSNIAMGQPIDTSTAGTYYYSITAEDDAGHRTTVSGQYQVVDTTPPEITINAPLDGAVYTLGQSVLADWSASDPGSGVASSSGTAESGEAIDTKTVGPKEFTVTAKDNAGNTNTVTRHYTVAYAYTPVTPSSTKVMQVKLGSGMPVKVVLEDSGGNLITNAVIQLYLAKWTGSAWDPNEITASSLTNPKDSYTFRYDPLMGQYVYNLNTKALAAGTWQLRIRSDDGTTQTMEIQIVK